MTLLQKYGGVDFWIDLINNFYNEVIASPILGHHFESKDMDGIKNMILGLIQTTFVNQGEAEQDYVRQAHKHLSITNQEMDEWINIYQQVLIKYKVNQEDRGRLLSVIESFRLYLVTSRY